MRAKQKKRSKSARLMIAAVMLISCVSVSACSTILFVRSPERRIYTDAVYESSKPFFLFGLVGDEYDIYADRICLGKDIDQVAIEYTPNNVLTGILTLGIYTPRTVKIWCQL